MINIKTKNLERNNQVNVHKNYRTFRISLMF